MSIVRNFNLYLNAGNGSAPYINVNQYDQGEQWVFTLYKEDGTKYTPSTGAIVGIKADNRGIINTGTVDADGRVVINETQQMTAAAGIAIFELLIDGDSHGTANFLVNVERRPGDNADLSDSDLSLIQQAVDSAAVIIEVIGDSDPSEVIGEHVDDWLDNHPEATTTVLDGAITAPKLNNSLWDKLLVNEEASGNPASFSDGADDVPVSSLKVALEPVQLGSGDPSPTNIRPIIASNGKNLLPPTIYNLASNNGAVVSNSSYRSMVAEVIGGETYTISRDVVSGNRFHIYGTETQPTVGVATHVIAQDNSGLSITFTVPTTDNYILVYLANDGSEITSKIQLERGSSASPYQPYHGIMVKRTGKNLFDKNDNSMDAGKLYPGASGVGYSNNASSVLIPCSPNTTYTLSKVVTNRFRLCWLSEYPVVDSTVCNDLIDNNTASSLTITTGATAKYLFAYVRTSSDTLTKEEVFATVQAEVGSTASEYEPFIGNSYPMALGQDVYGGSVDLATGVLTVTHGIVTDFSALASNGTSSTGAYRYKLAVTGVAGFTIGEAKCNMLKFMAGFNGNAGEFYNGTDIFNIFLADSTVASAITTLTGCQIIYPLATPTTVQLTPTEVKTLLGYNNISSSGTVDVIYHADTKLYVDKMTAVDNNIIAPTEQTFTATRNYTVNDLVIVNDTLYKVTANIATGSAITPNSNVQQTTLSALIKALS